MDNDLVLSAELYKYWQIDFRTATVKIVRQDGQILEDKLDAKFSSRESQIATVVFDWENWWIMSWTTRDDLIITMGFNPNSEPSFDNRPSVYLDQNRWRMVSDALYSPESVSDPVELEAARDLVHLAVDGGIVMPLSMGHMIETAGLHNERRYEIGLTMAQLSAGWQIRNPLDLWKYEAELTIRAHLGQNEHKYLHPIVTEPGALFGSDTRLGITHEMSGADKFIAMLTMPNVVLDTLIAPEPISKHPLTKWIDHHGHITSQVETERLPKDQRRQLARRRYWNENISFYTAPYRRITRANDFPMFSDKELADLLADSPMVGLLSELFIRRFIDRNNKWRRNDLIDIFHLSSAAAYADYVCAERHTGTQLREAQRSLGRHETVFTTLADLTAALRRDGVKAASERAS